MKVAMVIALIAIGLFGFGLPAFALDGPTPPELADPGPGAVAPHGGYDSGTDFCLQCHSVHTAPDPGYALMAQPSTTAVCATCHGIGGANLTGPIDPDVDTDGDIGTGGAHGTASTRAVYTSNAVHVIGANGPTIYASNWNYGWRYGGPQGPSAQSPPPAGTASAAGGGLYCASCHTPHGDFGQLVNSKWAYTSADQTGGASAVAAAVVPWQNNTRIWWENPGTGVWEQRYLWLDPNGHWVVCTLPSAGGTCDWAQTRDAEDQLVSLYGYKLLKSSPNHQYPVNAASPSGSLYSNAGAKLGDLVNGIAAGDTTLTVDETTGTLTARPSTSRGGAFIQIGNEIINITAISGTFPSASATYTVGGRGVNGTGAVAHAAGDDVLTWGTMRASIRSFKVDQYNHDGSLFCGTCHSSRVDWSLGGTSHNHPTGCEACHGNPSDGSSSDYPHSSTQPLLLQTVPDALCIQCHTQGSLP